MIGQKPRETKSKYSNTVFNFTTCNASTTFDKDEEGEYTKKIVVPSLENTMQVNNPHPHFGTTQNDTPARIVLNINLKQKHL